MKTSYKAKDVHGFRALKRRPMGKAFTRGHSFDDDALVRGDAAMFIGKHLAADPDLRWAYEEAQRIAAAPPPLSRGARVRAALANPVFAWSTAAVSLAVAIASFMASPYPHPQHALIAPSASSPVVAANTTAQGSKFPDAASRSEAGFQSAYQANASEPDTASWPGEAASPDGYSAPAFPAYNTYYNRSFTGAAVVLPGHVFVDAGSVAVIPFVVDQGASVSQSSPNARAVASNLYAHVMTRLEATPGIYVAQPMAVEPYAKSDLRADEIAAQLGVRGIVEGRVTATAQGRVRITLSLTDAATDDVMWHGTVERPTDAVKNMARPRNLWVVFAQSCRD